MINIPTVLILGAGASVSFGYPSGAGLVDLICSTILDNARFKGKGAQFRAMLDSMFPSDDVKRFAHQLRLSAQPSIDSFLEHNPNLADIGKAAITTAILLCDEKRQLSKPDWYSDLWQALRCNLSDFPKNQLTIVTFNYDNSLESFLGNAITATYQGATPEEVEKLLNTVKIVHIYGHVVRPPGPVLTPEDVRQISRDIKIIHDSEELSAPQIKLAKEFIAAAKRKVILGFGYDSTNLRRIGLVPGSPALLDGVSYATAYGLSEGRRWVLARERLGPCDNFFLGHDGWDCKRLLNEFCPLENCIYPPDDHHSANWYWSRGRMR